MKPEAKLKEKIHNKILSRGGDTQNHEDKNSIGIPDISYGINGINGWIEAKYLGKWPRSGVVKIDHYSGQQRNWLRIRGRAGGRCFLILQVDNVYMIFNHETAQSVGSMTQDEMMTQCDFCSIGDIGTNQLLEVII